MLGQGATKLLMVPSDDRWVAFVDSNPKASIFHHTAWMKLIADCYGYLPFVVALCNERGEITAGLPLVEVGSLLTGRRWVSLPFTDHCEPLSHNNVPPQALFEYLSELQIKYKVPRVELRAAIPHEGQVHRDTSQVLQYMKLSSDAEAIYRNFHRTRVQQSIAKAEREGVGVQWAKSERDLAVFYDLHLRTRHRLGVPVQPKRYFELLWQRIIEAGLGFILVAYKDSVPIAGGVFLTYNATLVYKHGASDRDYSHLCGNHMLLWTSILWGCEHGYTLFDWGKASIGNSGLRAFKSGWGPQESILTYSVFSATPPNRALDGLSGITEALIRHAPRWVCRMTGELLYRHFA